MRSRITFCRYHASLLSLGLLVHRTDSQLPSPEPRRAAVALIIRVVPSPSYPLPPKPSHPLTLPELFEQDWVNAPGARPELLFLRRGRVQNGNPSPHGSPPAGRKRKRQSSEQHVAFPGGRMEEGDEEVYIRVCILSHSRLVLGTDEPPGSDAPNLGGNRPRPRRETLSLHTPARQQRNHYLAGQAAPHGSLPFVFLQLVSEHLVGFPSEITLHWTAPANLVARRPTPSRLTPKHPIVRNAIRLLLGSMMFDAVVLNADDTVWFGSSKRRRTAGLAELLDTSGATRLKGPAHNGRELRLWGLTFGMTLDLVGHHLGVS